MPSGPIYNLQQVFDDPQIKARGLEIKVAHPFHPAVSLIGSPLQFSETPVAKPLAPPLAGQHSDAILEELGYDADARAALKAQGIV